MSLIRRTSHEPRFEMTPLIDVVFLLLTFFIYAMLLMVSIELLPMRLRTFIAGVPAEPAPVSVIAIDLDGRLFIDREETPVDGLLPHIQGRQEAEPGLMVYLALEDGDAVIDRAPMLQDIWDRLKDAGLELHLVGRPSDGASGPPATGTRPAD